MPQRVWEPPESSSYDSEFVARYREAQIDRVQPQRLNLSSFRVGQVDQFCIGSPPADVQDRRVDAALFYRVCE
jgi:hypothetical protein